MQEPVIVWPDFVKFCHFGIFLLVLPRMYFLGLVSIWQIFKRILAIFIIGIGQLVHRCKRPNIENDFAIWSHWPEWKSTNQFEKIDQIFTLIRARWLREEGLGSRGQSRGRKIFRQIRSLVNIGCSSSYKYDWTQLTFRLSYLKGSQCSTYYTMVIC